MFGSAYFGGSYFGGPQQPQVLSPGEGVASITGSTTVSGQAVIVISASASISGATTVLAVSGTSVPVSQRVHTLPMGGGRAPGSSVVSLYKDAEARRLLKKAAKRGPDSRKITLQLFLNGEVFSVDMDVNDSISISANDMMVETVSTTPLVRLAEGAKGIEGPRVSITIDSVAVTGNSRPTVELV